MIDLEQISDDFPLEDISENGYSPSSDSRKETTREGCFFYLTIAVMIGCAANVLYNYSPTYFNNIIDNFFK
jgi:hypothetical protein